MVVAEEVITQISDFFRCKACLLVLGFNKTSWKTKSVKVAFSMCVCGLVVHISKAKMLALSIMLDFGPSSVLMSILNGWLLYLGILSPLTSLFHQKGMIPTSRLIRGRQINVSACVTF